MGSEATYTVGLDDPLLSPLDVDAFLALAQIPDDWNMEDLLRLDESAGHIPPDPQSTGLRHSTIAGLRQPVLYDPVGLAGPTAAAAGNLPEQNAHPWSGPTLTQPATCSIIGNAGTGMAEPHSWSPLLGFNMREINAVLNPTAAVKDILSAENPPQEPSPLVDNAGLAMPEPDPYSSWDSSCRSTNADMGISSSPYLEVNAGAGLLPSGGGLTEAPVRVLCKRKRVVGGSSIQRSTPPEFNLEDFLSHWGSPSSPLRRHYLASEWESSLRPQKSCIKPPTGSTDHGIICFLRQEEIRMVPWEEVNQSLGEQDQTAPKVVQSYVTTAEMMPDQKTHLGYWKEKQVKPLGVDDSDGLAGFWEGLKRTFQFHRHDGTKTNWFMHEYIPTDVWGNDWYMTGLRFREVYEEVHEGAEVPVQGEPTSLEVKIKNKTAAMKKHRMRGPENLVIKGESPAWQHFIKIYDKHPELEGSKVVYAVCCHCKVVLKAGTDNGTKSLLTHCDRTCPVKNKKQQPSSSSPYSTGDTSCPSTAADMGRNLLDQDFNAVAGLLQSGSSGSGCTLAETPVRASCKRKKLVCGSSSQRSTLPGFNFVELLAGLVQSDPSSTDIMPPTGSTDIEIIHFLIKREESSMPRRKEVNLSLGQQDQMAPKVVHSYVTTVNMMPDQNPHDLRYWKEKEVKHLRDYESEGIIWCRGLKRTLQFHMNDGTKTNWFMHEYVPTDLWGRDLFMKRLRFREVYEGAEVPGEPTSPEEKIKNKISAAKKHRMRGPENMVIKGESPAWQHFIKIYDKHPELVGSKVVYAVCCHCEGVLKAGTGNGTKSLLTHCNRTCPVKNNKNQQPSSSSYQENRFGILVGVGVP